MSGKPILGIDLRVTSVKVVEIENNKITNWGQGEVPYALVDKHPQKEDAQAEVLLHLVQSRRMKAKEAVVVVGGDDVFVKLFTLSEISKAEAADVIKWKFSEEIPFPVEEAIIDFYPLSSEAGEKTTEKVDYVAACMNQKLYHEIEYIMSKAGIRLVGITVVAEALQKLFEKQIEQEKHQVLSIIYMGKRTTNISIVREGHLEFNRELAIGGENFTQAMSGVVVSAGGKIEINHDMAEKIKLEYGLPIDAEKFVDSSEVPFSQLQAMVRPILKRVQDEVMRTFEYYKGQSGVAAIDKILLSGGSALTPNFTGFLSEGLAIPVVVEKGIEKTDVAENLSDPESFERALPQLSAAIGVAQLGGEKINLMPEEAKFFWKLWLQRFLKPQYFFSSLIVLFALIYFVLWLQALTLRNEINRVEKKLLEYQPRIAMLEAIEKTAEREVEKKLLLKVYAEKRSKMPMVFEELSSLVPQSVVITTLNLKPNELHLFGTAYGKYDTAENILSKFVLSLSSSAYFGEVKLLEAVRSYDYMEKAFNFEIVARLKITK